MRQEPRSGPKIDKKLEVMKQFSVLIGGDICPRDRNLQSFRDGNADAIFGDLLPEIRAADLSVVNLECPLITEKSPTGKVGPVLGESPDCVNGLAKAEIDVACLANNHILDHGESGLRQTVAALDAAGIAWTGAGEDLASANSLLIKEVRGVRIAFLAATHREFCLAGRDSWGANPIDPISFARLVREESDKYDYLVVVLHAGAEHHPYPSPELLKTCRFMVEFGAHAVICQHSHCPGCFEYYQGAPIVYGQGNLIFDGQGLEKHWYEGFLVKLSPDISTGELQLDIIPYMQSYGQSGARRMTATEEEAFRGDIEERCAILDDETKLEQKWIDHCRSQESMYLSSLRWHDIRIVRSLVYRLGLQRRLLSKRAITILLNLFRCETHREAVCTLLSLLHEESADERSR